MIPTGNVLTTVAYHEFMNDTDCFASCPSCERKINDLLNNAPNITAAIAPTTIPIITGKAGALNSDPLTSFIAIKLLTIVIPIRTKVPTIVNTILTVFVIFLPVDYQDYKIHHACT